MKSQSGCSWSITKEDSWDWISGWYLNMPNKTIKLEYSYWAQTPLMKALKKLKIPYKTNKFRGVFVEKEVYDILRKLRPGTQAHMSYKERIYLLEKYAERRTNDSNIPRT